MTEHPREPASAAPAAPLLQVRTGEQMTELGRALAALLRPGDLVLLTGDLGAGKTTLARGVGEGLAVRGAVTSPTFVIAREHPAAAPGGTPLVHVDAYRLAGLDELADLDLSASLEEAVTLVEWGHGLAEGLADDRLEVLIERSDDPSDDTRVVRFVATGSRWGADELAALGRAGLGPDGRRRPPA